MIFICVFVMFIYHIHNCSYYFMYRRMVHRHDTKYHLRCIAWESELALIYHAIPFVRTISWISHLLIVLKS